MAYERMNQAKLNIKIIPDSAWFFVLLLLGLFAYLLYQHRNDSDIFAATGAWLGALAVIFALIVAFFQLRDFRRSAEFDACTRLMERLTTRDYADATLHLNSMDPVLHTRMKVAEFDKAVNAARVILNEYERIGQAINFGLVSEDVMLEGVVYDVLVGWPKLIPFIELQQKQGASYFRNAVDPHAKAEAYRRRHDLEEPHTMKLEDAIDIARKTEKQV